MSPETSVATELLRTLHRILRQLEDLNERLARGPRLIRAREANLAQAERQRDAARAEQHTLKVATDEKQLQLGSHEASIKKRRTQLLQASSNHEYQALKDEIEASAAANEVLEIEILEAMERLDTLGEKLAQRGAEVEAAKKEVERARTQVDSEKPLVEGDVARLQQELSETEAELPAAFREHYSRVVRGRGQDALAAVESEYCSGCHQHVPVNIINELMLSRPLACRSCGRLLYLPEVRE